VLLEENDLVGEKIAKNFVGQGGWYMGLVVTYSPSQDKCEVSDRERERVYYRTSTL